MYSLKPLTPPSLSITKATSSSDVLLCDATPATAAAAAAAAGGGVLMQSAPPPVVITTPADVVSSVELDKDVMRRNLSMVDTAEGVSVDTASGSDQQHGLPSYASKTFSQSV